MHVADAGPGGVASMMPERVQDTPPQSDSSPGSESLPLGPATRYAASALGVYHDPSDPDFVGSSDVEVLDDSSIADDDFFDVYDDDQLGPVAGELPYQAGSTAVAAGPHETVSTAVSIFVPLPFDDRLGGQTHILPSRVGYDEHTSIAQGAMSSAFNLDMAHVHHQLAVTSRVLGPRIDQSQPESRQQDTALSVAGLSSTDHPPWLLLRGSFTADARVGSVTGHVQLQPSMY
uniref:Uncharacterized protein n=1 Tax=Peronospora matthiolae TaxID=2874970 RepID=A0AAV1U9B0_9STRA